MDVGSVVLIVKKEDLPRTPVAFQQYVEAFFEEKLVNRVPSMVCVTFTAVPRAYQPRSGIWDGNGAKKGVGPSHTVELRHFRSGLLPQTDLGAWIQESQLVTKIPVPASDPVRGDY